MNSLQRILATHLRIAGSVRIPRKQLTPEAQGLVKVLETKGLGRAQEFQETILGHVASWQNGAIPSAVLLSTLANDAVRGVDIDTESAAAVGLAPVDDYRGDFVFLSDKNLTAVSRALRKVPQVPFVYFGLRLKWGYKSTMSASLSKGIAPFRKGRKINDIDDFKLDQLVVQVGDAAHFGFEQDAENLVRIVGLPSPEGHKDMRSFNTWHMGLFVDPKNPSRKRRSDDRAFSIVPGATWDTYYEAMR